MKLSHIYEVITEVQSKIQDIDCMNISLRRINQKQLNEAYTILDEFKDELIRESIKIKQRRNNKNEGNN